MNGLVFICLLWSFIKQILYKLASLSSGSIYLFSDSKWIHSCIKMNLFSFEFKFIYFESNKWILSHIANSQQFNARSSLACCQTGLGSDVTQLAGNGLACGFFCDNKIHDFWAGLPPFVNWLIIWCYNI